MQGLLAISEHELSKVRMGLIKRKIEASTAGPLVAQE
jgi:hypothetical protein